MLKLIFSIGVPGSGKSTVMEKLSQKYGYTYVSPDQIRAELSGDAADQSRNSEVWPLAYRRMADALKAGNSVVFDATFTAPTNRQDVINIAKENGAQKIQAVRLDIDPEIAKERNAARDRVVPDHVIDRMNNDLVNYEPSTEEGIDAIFSLNEFQNLQEVEKMSDEGPISKELGR